MISASKFSREELHSMAAAGEEVVNCMRVLARTGDNVVGELLKATDTFYEWDHYPEGDILDPETHAQYYYHAHRPGEHGHFHTFLRPAGMPANCKPAPLPDHMASDDVDDFFTHIIGISMDARGVPIRLFIPNRWLTGETWYAAEDVSAMIDRFEIDLAHPSWPVNRWIGSMLQLFRPQIIELLKERDTKIAEMAAAQPDVNVYEDRDTEILAVRNICIDDQIGAIANTLGDASQPH